MAKVEPGKSWLRGQSTSKVSASARPFLAVNCAGIPPDLMESDSSVSLCRCFYWCTARRGLSVEVNGGTLLLDEIGEMLLALQAKLLRCCRRAVSNQWGLTSEEMVDVRILAATHVDELGLLEVGHFREDLYYRLETLSLTVPPLRERDEDVELLAMHFLGEAQHVVTAGGSLGFSDVTLRILPHYPFPGNVRELSSDWSGGHFL